MSVNRIKELVSLLNEYRDAYYNQQNPVVSDYEYDNLFDELKALEDSTGFIMTNSPTQSVGYEVKSELQKVKHSHPMLSLDKTKDVHELIKFAGEQDCILSCKMDGLTILLTYDNGVLIKAETRGNGEIGEDVTHNAKVFENIPLTIPNTNHIEIEGEAIITYKDFEKINATLPEDSKYKNPRNLASGSVRQLDSSIAKNRHLKFIVWKMPKGFMQYFEGLRFAKDLGFDVVPFFTYTNNSSDRENIEEMVESLKKRAEEMSYPIDGLVMTYNSIEYGKTLGMTGHHPKHSIAFKFYDEEVESKLLSIDWTMGKTGVLTPTAVFEPVEIDGTTVERASLHNVSILTDLELSVGDTISVYKANQIIPQIKENLSAIHRHNQVGIGQMEYVSIPAICPICGGSTSIKKDNDSEVLVCNNPNCRGKLLGKLSHFVSKNAMDISGLSEATLEKMIENGYVESFIDIYELKNGFYDDVVAMEGFGKKSADKLMAAIEQSKNTTLSRFIYALCIPMIGRTASKTISKYFNDDFIRFYNEGLSNEDFNWSDLDDFGTAMTDSIREYSTTDNLEMIWELSTYLEFEKSESTTTNNNSLDGKVFVITGSLNTFDNRDAAKDMIESCGGKVVGSVSKKTDYLVNNDILSTSGKNKKAKELNIPIITEEELLQMLK